METQTRFDLNAAVQTWQQELAAQPDLTSDVRHELETHLRDTVTELQRRGLNDEESFWLARRRAGQPKLIGEEFAKADPARVWRERAFWIAVGLLVLRLWSGTGMYAWKLLAQGLLRVALKHPSVQLVPDWVLFYLPFLRIDFFHFALSLNNNSIIFWLVYYLPWVCIISLLAQGRLTRIESWLRMLFESRKRFVFVAAVIFALNSSWSLLVLATYAAQPHLNSASPSVPQITENVFISLFQLAMHLVLIVWLVPGQNRGCLRKV